jgi:hypothetical protein
VRVCQTPSLVIPRRGKANRRQVVEHGLVMRLSKKTDDVGRHFRADPVDIE